MIRLLFEYCPGFSCRRGDLCLQAPCLRLLVANPEHVSAARRQRAKLARWSHLCHKTPPLIEGLF